MGECNIVSGTEGTPTGVNADFVAGIPDPPRPVVPIPLTATETCPYLSTDGSQSRYEGGIKYKFYCGKFVQATGGFSGLPTK